MYVRGKYGKSLKLDKLKETTPAAKDNLNTIGNSRSTPKEKLATAADSGKPGSNCKSKHGSGSSNGSSKSSNGGNPKTPLLDTFENNPFMAAMSGMTSLAGNAGNNIPLGGVAESRVKDVRQALLDHTERLKELEKHMGSEQAKLLMPFFTGNGNLPMESTTTNEAPKDEQASTDIEMTAEKERQVQEILIEATRKNEEQTTIEDDHNKNNLNNDHVLKPLEAVINAAAVSANAGGAEISA